MKHRIVVLGAGYAGTFAAGRIARKLSPKDVQITVVNAEPDFVERVRMHQLAAGQELDARPLAPLFEPHGVALRVARVTAVDPDRKTVAMVDTTGADELAYDTLVYALGSGWNDQGVPGAAEHTYQIASRSGALELRERLARVEAGQTVTVVGGGLTGIEAATEIAESRPDLHVAMVLCGALGEWLSPKGQAHLREVADRLGIAVHEHATVVGVGPDAVTTAEGETIPAAVTVWTTGFAAHPIAAATTMTVSGTGQIVVDETMRSVSHPDVYAIGDSACAMGPGDKPLRMSCASGIPVAIQAADAIVARLTGDAIPRTSIRYYHQCISLGREDGIIQMVTADDTATTRAWVGRGAARYKEMICWGAYQGVANPTFWMPSFRRRVASEQSAADPSAEALA